MVEGGLGLLWSGAAFLAVVSAVPLIRLPRDSESEDYQNIDLSAYANFTANEVCFSEGEVFQRGDVMPNPGPCEECRCEPPSIVCQMVRCPVNHNGCKTIQKPNHCCPDYKCECDYNNQLFGDGERIELPEDPCQVCYCKGGEVMCTSLKCYLRNDCQPQHVPGQCCPKYENCPIRDLNATNGENKSHNKTIKREMQPWLLTKAARVTSGALPRRSTTEKNAVIVSDWLNEKRSTTELTTQELNLDGSVVVRRSGTITPLEEVIFTRIDILRDKEQEPTVLPDNVSKEKGSTVTTELFETTPESVSVSEESGTDPESSSNLKYNSAADETTQSVEADSSNKNDDKTEISEYPKTNSKEEIFVDEELPKNKPYTKPTLTPIKLVIHEIEKDNPDLVIINDSTQSTIQEWSTTMNDQETSQENLNTFSESKRKQQEEIITKGLTVDEECINCVLEHFSTPLANDIKSKTVSETKDNTSSTSTEYTTVASNTYVNKEIVDNSLEENSNEYGISEGLNNRLVLSTQTDGTVYIKNKTSAKEDSESTTISYIEDYVIKKSAFEEILDDKTNFHLNPTRRPANPLNTTDNLKNSAINISTVPNVTESNYFEQFKNPTTQNENNYNLETSEKPIFTNQYPEISVFAQRDSKEKSLQEDKKQLEDSKSLENVHTYITEEFVSSLPVLGLNGHVSYLRLGGHSSSKSPNDKSYYTTSENKDRAEEISIGSSSTKDLDNEDFEKYSTVNLDKYEEKVSTTNSFTTSEDLAEYLVTEALPVLLNNRSNHSSNIWLKDNLTTEDFITAFSSSENTSTPVTIKTNEEQIITSQYLTTSSAMRDNILNDNSITDYVTGTFIDKQFEHNKLKTKTDLSLLKTQIVTNGNLRSTTDQHTQVEISTGPVLENISIKNDSLHENQSRVVIEPTIFSLVSSIDSSNSAVDMKNTSKEVTKTNESLFKTKSIQAPNNTGTITVSENTEGTNVVYSESSTLKLT